MNKTDNRVYVIAEKVTETSCIFQHFFLLLLNLGVILAWNCDECKMGAQNVFEISATPQEIALQVEELTVTCDDLPTAQEEMGNFDSLTL